MLGCRVWDLVKKDRVLPRDMKVNEGTEFDSLSGPHPSNPRCVPVRNIAIYQLPQLNAFDASRLFHEYIQTTSAGLQ